ncbi:MAG TPA: 2,3-bisphosphoglycerate-independent phosphoglycerate mutase [Alphaproteobacteria bacterium]|jgi:2,3-bisphosphoglycerate-independent phosphoglycerate mutase|nr:2,3-bisphosphoglycerate-independent phosphoglycerate mutase [Alphaproteobacteria bacterium]
MNAPDRPPPANPRQPRPVVLCVLDGWGYRPECEDNAICEANAPEWRHLTKDYPNTLIQASEHFVGLPDGQMGNSEVGHMNLGAGRVVFQDMPRIELAIQDGSIRKNAVLNDFIARMKASGGTVHAMGLVSPGGVHAMQTQIAAIVRLVAEAGVKVAIHTFLDGRDTPPSSARGYLEKFQRDIAGLSNASIATVSGRYYAMDRDKRWERVEKAWRALVLAEGEHAPNPDTAVTQSYANKVTDEFVLPTIIDGYRGMADGDGVLMLNFRADRAREILTSLLDPAFTAFARSKTPRFAAAAGLAEYSTELNKLMTALFPQQKLTHLMGEVVAERGLKQLRIAETEKYAHVTFFFNGGEERQYPGEERILVPSPKVATYDLKPEMSAYEVTDKLVAAIESGTFDFILVNYANGDMVGHTGDLQAAIKAVEAVDKCLGRIEAALKKVGGTMFITADHGNAELMRDYEHNQPHTAHTLFTVPAILVNGPKTVTGLSKGRLADVAPTMLDLLGLPQPTEMTGHSLLVKSEEGHAPAGTLASA